jgi:protein translocase subunit secA
MSLFNKFLTGLFGNKSDRDIKEVSPVVEAIKLEYKRVSQLSNDELRNETHKLKAQIKSYIQAEEDEIAQLKERAESGEIPLEEGEKIYDRVDKLEEIIDKKIEEILLQVLPIAFSIVKDTARRFTENQTITVTATDFDRNLATQKDFCHYRRR